MENRVNVAHGSEDQGLWQSPELSVSRSLARARVDMPYLKTGKGHRKSAVLPCFCNVITGPVIFPKGWKSNI